MPVNDTFRCEVMMPGGKSDLIIALRSRGTLLMGIVDAPFGKYSFNNGTFSRNNITWTINLKSQLNRPDGDVMGGKPKGFLSRFTGFLTDSFSGPPLGMPVRMGWYRPKKDLFVHFDGRFDGDRIYGDLKFGKYEFGKFRGYRVSYDAE